MKCTAVHGTVKPPNKGEHLGQWPLISSSQRLSILLFACIFNDCDSCYMCTIISVVRYTIEIFMNKVCNDVDNNINFDYYAWMYGLQFNI